MSQKVNHFDNYSTQIWQQWKLLPYKPFTHYHGYLLTYLNKKNVSTAKTPLKIVWAQNLGSISVNK